MRIVHAWVAAIVVLLATVVGWGPAGTAAAQEPLYEPDAEGCIGDVADDTYGGVDGGPSPGHPEVDLQRVCVTYDERLTFSALVAGPTDPQREPRWWGGAQVAWRLDVDGDAVVDYSVVFGRSEDNTRLVAYVYRWADGVIDPAPVCEGTPRWDGGPYVAEGIDPACLGSPASFALWTEIELDDDADYTNDWAGFFDVAPERDTWMGPVTQLSPVARDRDRLAGGSRIETAVAIAQHAFPSGAATAYLVGADGLADAVAGGALTDGPLLLVPACGAVPQAVADEVARLDAQRVVALGGPAVVCEEVLQAVGGGRDTDRLAGDDRFATAAAIARAAFPGGAPTAYLARADVLADAVAAGGLADGPVLLVPRCGALPDVVTAALRDLRPEFVVALGGEQAVCRQVLEDAAAAAPGRPSPTGRIAGASRIDTAVEISQAAFPQGAQAVHLASADTLVDAVSAGTLTTGPILLVPPCGDLPHGVAQEIVRLDASVAVAIGGGAAVCDSVLDDATRAA